MSQHDMVVANASGATVRADINSALQALASTSKGNARPSTIYAGQLWLDDNTPSATEWTLYLYDGADDIPVGTFDSTANTFEPVIGSALALHADGWVFAVDTDTGPRRSAADTITYKTGGTDRITIDSSGLTVATTGAIIAKNAMVAGGALFWSSGTPTALRSHNISSYTDHATGDVTANLSVTMATANPIIVTGGNVVASVNSGVPVDLVRNSDRTLTTTAVPLLCHSTAGATAVDGFPVSFAVFEGA